MLIQTPSLQFYLRVSVSWVDLSGQRVLDSVKIERRAGNSTLTLWKKFPPICVARILIFFPSTIKTMVKLDVFSFLYLSLSYPFVFKQGNSLQVSPEEEYKPLVYIPGIFTVEGASVIYILQMKNRIRKKLKELVRVTQQSAGRPGFHLLARVLFPGSRHEECADSKREQKCLENFIF